MAETATPIDIEETLSNAPLFAGLNKRQLKSIVPFAKGVTLESDAVVFREGDPARFVLVVARGRIALEMAIDKPKKRRLDPVVVGVMGSGDVVGLSALVDPYVLNLTATAKGKCQAIQIDARALRKVFAKDHDLGLRVTTSMGTLLSARLTMTRKALMHEVHGFVYRTRSAR